RAKGQQGLSPQPGKVGVLGGAVRRSRRGRKHMARQACRGRRQGPRVDLRQHGVRQGSGGAFPQGDRQGGLGSAEREQVGGGRVRGRDLRVGDGGGESGEGGGPRQAVWRFAF